MAELVEKVDKGLQRNLKKSSSKIQHGHNVHPNTSLVKYFGCSVCTWKGTDLCPHGYTARSKGHPNKICADRAKYISERLQQAKYPRILQEESAVKSRLVADRLLQEFALSGELSPEYNKAEKNLISLLDRMRKQDEGVKIRQDINVTHDELKKVIDVHAEKIKPGSKPWLEGEFKDVKERDNGKGKGESQEKA